MSYESACLLSWGIGWVISILVILTGYLLYRKFRSDDILIPFSIFGGFGFLISTTGFLSYLPQVIGNR